MVIFPALKRVFGGFPLEPQHLDVHIDADGTARRLTILQDGRARAGIRDASTPVKP